MLGVGRLPPPSAPPLVQKKPTIFSSLPIQHKIQNAKLPFLPELLSNYSSLSLSSSSSCRTGFCLFAQKKEENPNLGAIKMEKVEDFEEDDEVDFDEEDDIFDDEDEDFDEEFDDDDELMVPYDKMNDWLEKKPKGFGEGKVYDTSVEDNLLEEIEQSFKAQLANITKLKNERKKPDTKNDSTGVLLNGVPGGIRVRINNLPKKRNIHRDLKSAFEGVPGIIKISPVNSGNKKTRDPVCKGLAYVDFKSLAEANRFIQMFSGQNIAFGKSEKPIKCEILKPLDGSEEVSSFDGYNSTSEGSFIVSEEEEEEDEEDEEDDVEQNDTELQLNEDDDFVYEELIKGIQALDSNNALGDLLQLSASERIKRVEMLESKLLARISSGEVEMEAPKMKSVVKNMPDKKPSQISDKKPSQITDKKPSQKTDKKPSQKTDKKPNQKTDKKPSLKPEQKPKQRIPGSAKKLKFKEKAKLADVFARYGTSGASASKQK
ncbi:uncharacterized protein [Spinacia oleracea]|nr:uncharacterized protein LOC110777533 isoform X2 [Spinacia oleracea]XP_056691067.1 uncharacterized protein LOC110777533 isoform X2 [Spinacia oleracea]XP_056691068.1 uncharacterized protein LOC110777533 isoform X2 [Spinacia oleracea]